MTDRTYRDVTKELASLILRLATQVAVLDMVARGQIPASSALDRAGEENKAIRDACVSLGGSRPDDPPKICGREFVVDSAGNRGSYFCRLAPDHTGACRAS
jgi:hypothetical protein